MELSRDVPVTSAASSTVSRRNRHADFGLLALAISATVFLGFWFTYFGPIVAGAYPASSPLVHLHASLLATNLFLSTPTPVGQAIARGLAWVGGTLGFLY